MKKLFNTSILFLILIISYCTLYTQDNKSFQFEGRIQVRGLYTDPDSLNTLKSGFRVRRAQFVLKGNPYEHFSFKVQALFREENSSGNLWLQDAWAATDYIPYITLQAGQFVPPFSYERVSSNTEIYTTERSIFVDNLVPAAETNARDIGFMAYGTALNKGIQYYAGAFNGNGADVSYNDDNNFMYVGRLLFEPLNKDMKLDFGGSVSYREANKLSFTKIKSLKYPFTGKDFRFGLELNYNYGPFSLLGEYIRADFKNDTVTVKEIKSDGYYLMGGYYIFDKWQAIVKYETYRANVDQESKYDLNWLHIGLNYYIVGNKLKLMGDFIIKHEGVTQIPNNTAMIQAQLIF